MTAHEDEGLLAGELKGQALEHGFALAGVVDLALAQDAFGAHVGRYDAWLAAGYGGAMQYLVRGRDRRADPRLVFSETRSIFCVALPYANLPFGAQSARQGPRYARYLNGPDYHHSLATRLEATLRAVAERTGLGEQLRWKVCVDTSAVLERSWAALAGLGWIGKNALLIHPKLGSYFFLGVALLNQPTAQGPALLPNLCGHCTRCLEACPGRALGSAQGLDSRRCVSYWTLEKRGALEIDEPSKQAIQAWVAGCDICQEVCPFNLKPAKQEASGDLVSARLLMGWPELLAESADEYRARTLHNALDRVKTGQFSRNLAIALANAVLLNPEVDFSALFPAVRARADQELTPDARAEWLRCVQILSAHPIRPRGSLN